MRPCRSKAHRDLNDLKQTRTAKARPYCFAGIGKLRISAATPGYLAASASRLPKLDIRRLDAGPFCRGAEEPPPPADHAGGVECVARDIQLHAMALAQIRADDVTFSRPAFQQHQHFDRIAKIIMIELIVADAVELHRLLGRHHKVKRRSSRPSVRKRGLHTASSNLMLADEGDADIAACRVWREVKELAHILKCHVTDHVRRSSGDCHG